MEFSDHTSRHFVVLYTLSILLVIAFGYELYSNRVWQNPHTVAIVDSNGRPVLVAASTLPDPIIAGKSYPRQMKLSGLTLYDHRGDETGGIGIMSDCSTVFHALAFDYRLHDAIFLYSIDKGQTFESGFAINDKDLRRTDPAKVRSIQRITISDENKNASIVLRDKNGRERIVLSVDSNDVAKIFMKDTLGNIIK